MCILWVHVVKKGVIEMEYFELCYPERVYEIILDECIINLKEYFVQRNIDPFLSFNSDQLIAVQF